MKRRDLLKAVLAVIPGLAFLQPAKATPRKDLGNRKFSLVRFDKGRRGTFLTGQVRAIRYANRGGIRAVVAICSVQGGSYENDEVALTSIRLPIDIPPPRIGREYWFCVGLRGNQRWASQWGEGDWIDRRSQSDPRRRKMP